MVGKREIYFKDLYLGYFIEEISTTLFRVTVLYILLCVSVLVGLHFRE